MSIDRLQLLPAAYGALTHHRPGVLSSPPTNHCPKRMQASFDQIQVKPQSIWLRAALLGAWMLLAALPVTADTPTYYWDISGTDPGAGYPIDGDWDNTSPNWTSDPSGNSATFAYPGRASVVFAATGDPDWTDIGG